MDKLLSGRRILVVEDEMLIVMMIESMLGVARSADLIRLSVEMGIGRQVP